VGLRVGLDRYGKSRPHRVSIPGPFSPYPVAIPTELPGPHCIVYRTIIIIIIIIIISILKIIILMRII
jgi:hypothetical protein